MLRFISILILFFISSAFAKDYQYELTLCSIFQNDAKYMPEWIEFHQKQGIEHFYLYNNRSTDNYQEILSPYIRSGLVEIINWDIGYEVESQWLAIQCAAYMDCIKKIKKKARWCAFLDTDEFLFNPNFTDLRQVLKNYTHHCGVVAYWMMYGTSGVEKILQGERMLNKLVMRRSVGESQGKSIVQPKYVTKCHNPHYFFYKDGGITVNENKTAIAPEHFFEQKYTGNILRINHYWSRDLDYFYNVKLARRQRWGNEIQSLIDYERLFNEVYDPILSTRP